jgi:hypothetical protein
LISLSGLLLSIILFFVILTKIVWKISTFLLAVILWRIHLRQTHRQYFFLLFY